MLSNHTLQRKFNISNFHAKELFNYIIDYKVIEVLPEVIENNENDPDDPENEIWSIF